MRDIIEVSDLTKRFKEKVAVNGISFSVRQGSIFGFLGTNGAGKTTTIKMLTGLLLPTEGIMRVCDLNPSTQEKQLALKIGVVPEQITLYEDMSVENNLLFFSKLYGVEPKRVKEVMGELELESHGKVAIKKLSKGFKQRTLIARALLHNPELLFMDEPTSGLDPHIAVEIRQMIRRLRAAGKTVFLTTHYMNEAEELCDEIAIIDQGNIVLKQDVNAIKSKSSGRRIVVKTTEYEREFTFDRLHEISAIPADSIVSIQTCGQSLEEVFLQLTKG